jgi:hypothetical protein
LENLCDGALLIVGNKLENIGSESSCAAARSATGFPATLVKGRTFFVTTLPADGVSPYK